MKFKYCSEYGDWKVYVNDFENGSLGIIDDSHNLVVVEIDGIIKASTNRERYFKNLNNVQYPEEMFSNTDSSCHYVVEFITDNDCYMVSFKILNPDDLKAEEEC